jgi:hypothetical protein
MLQRVNSITRIHAGLHARTANRITMLKKAPQLVARCQVALYRALSSKMPQGSAPKLSPKYSLKPPVVSSGLCRDIPKRSELESVCRESLPSLQPGYLPFGGAVNGRNGRVNVAQRTVWFGRRPLCKWM